MSLRDLTSAKHTEAEKTEYAKYLLSGNITKEHYRIYLYNMVQVYHQLETYGKAAGLFSDLPGLDRLMAIWEDYNELSENELLPPTITQAAMDYSEYLSKLSAERPQDLMAHIYVRHMGDLFGGQMIKKKVPGSGKFYEFENRTELITKVREKLDDSMGAEANVAFDYAIAIMRELEKISK